MIKKIIFWAGLIVTAVCLYFVLRGIDFAELMAVVSRINVPILCVTIVLYLAGYYIRAERWHHMLKHIKQIV